MSRSKGNRIQRKAISYLEEDGYRVSKAEQGGRFNTEKDLFGLFDAVAIHRKGEVMFVQVTTNRPHTHKDYIQWSKKYRIKNLHYTQMVWYDRRGWVIFTYANGKKYKLDLRK